LGYEEEHADARRGKLEALIARALQTLGVREAERLAGEAVEQFADVTAPY
jgi:hypothetical protein